MAGSDDRPVLAAAERLLRENTYVGVHDVLKELRWRENRRLALMRAMKLLIDRGDLVGKVLAGDAKILDVTLTAITEKGLDRLGLT